MGPLKHRPRRSGSQGSRRRPARRPRTRRCLLKGCEKPFRPPSARSRYCSPECTRKAREWSRWRAQQKYRKSDNGKKHRNEQCRHYRERKHERDENRGARGSSLKEFRKSFRLPVRPPGMLRRLPPHPAITAAALLLPGLPQGPSTRPPAGMPVAAAGRHAARIEASPRSPSRPGTPSEIVFPYLLARRSMPRYAAIRDEIRRRHDSSPQAQAPPA